MKHQGDFYNKTNFWQGDRWEELMKLSQATPLEAGNVRLVADIGCGSGKFTKRLLEFFPQAHVKAIDTSSSMLETARRENPSPQVDYMEMDAERVGNLGGDFDVVHSNFVLHWVEDKHNVMKGINKITHAGSYLLLGTCQDLPGILWDIDAMLRREFKVDDSMPVPFHYFDLKGWSDLLHVYGWRLEAIQGKHDGHYVSDAREYFDHWVAASAQKICYGHWGDDLSEVQKSKIVHEILEKYRYEGNGLLFSEETLLMVARRVSV